MKPSYFHYIIQNHYQKGLDEKLLNTVSLAKDVLNNIENACSTFFSQRRVSLFMCKYISIVHVIVHVVVRIYIYIYIYYYYTTVPLVNNNADTQLRRLRVVLVNSSILVFFIKQLYYYSCFNQHCNKWHMTDV